VPAVVAFSTGIVMYFISDDCPKGNYKELKKNGMMPEVSAAASFRSGALNFNTWLLFLQYACCFGVELTMNNAAALYFREEFGQSTEAAAAIASIFGWMNLFARGLGGYTSDKLNAKCGMRGRIFAQTILLVIEGALVLVFAQSGSLAGAIVIMVFFSVFVQAAEGSTYGIVPYVDPPSTGSIAGIVGAGGNTGAVGFGLGFRQLSYKSAFNLMGIVILASGILSIFIVIKGHRGLIFGTDAPENKAQALAVPEPDEEETAEVNKEPLVEKMAAAAPIVTEDIEPEPEEEEHHA
jgi:NNP family nitrate/nitrite transporter-like MFS transporter